MAFDWTQTAVADLRRMWDAGRTALEISAHLRIAVTPRAGRNAVIGKARRLGLAARPSPIKPWTPKPEKPARPEPTLPPLVSVVEPAPPTARGPHATTVVWPYTPGKRQAPVPVVEPPAEPDPVPTIFKPRAASACCWPIGEPRTKGFRFCDDPSEPGRPYCGEHAKISRAGKSA